MSETKEKKQHKFRGKAANQTQMLKLSTGAHKNIIEKTVTYQNKKKRHRKKEETRNVYIETRQRASETERTNERDS